MSSIPSFITNITSWIYGASFEDTPLVEQFRSYLGLSPTETIPDTFSTEQKYITFLSKRVSILQYISTLSTQLFGSSENVENDIASFRSFLHLQSSDAIPDTEASKEAFADYVSQRSSTTLYIATLTKDIYGSSVAATDLLDGFRESIGLLADQPVPDTPDIQASFLSYLATKSNTMAFISGFTKLMTGSDITDAQINAFRGYLGLESTDAIPDAYDTCSAFINFLGQTNSMATYAASAVKNAYGTSIIQNISILAEFIASIGLNPDTAIPDDADTKRTFLYFLTSPTTLAAQGFYGISQAAADSLSAFRATFSPALSEETPIPTDDDTYTKYLAYLHGTDPSPAHLDIAKFMEDKMLSMTGSSLTNDDIAQFRIYLSLKSSDAIPNDDATKSIFMNFLQEKRAVVGQSEAVNAISPTEEKIRRILFSAFSMVLEMLTTLQQTSRVESAALQIYAEWEKEYTNLLSSTPIYGPTVLNQVIANDSDFGKTTLGHENITVRQVADYLLSQIQKNGSTSEEFRVTNIASSNPGFPCFLLTKNNDGSYTFTVRAPQRDSWGGFVGGWQNLLSATVMPSTSLTGQDQSDVLLGSMMQILTQKWQTNSFDTASFNTYITVSYRQPSGDDVGDLVTGGGLYKVYPSSYLKTLWNGTKQTVLWTDEHFGGYGEPYTAVHEYFNLPYSVGFNVTDWSKYITMHDLVLSQLPLTPDAWNNFSVGGTVSGGTYDGFEFRMQIHNVSTDSNPNAYTMVPYLTGKDSEGNTVIKWGPTYHFNTTSLNSDITTGLWGPWNEPGAGAWQETIPYPSEYPKESLQNVRSQSSSYIGEINAQLQQYIQSTQARKTNLDNSMKVMQNLMSQTTQATSNQANLLDTIMQAVKSILTSIFH
jgi:hypothetical protein